MVDMLGFVFGGRGGRDKESNRIIECEFFMVIRRCGSYINFCGERVISNGDRIKFSGDRIIGNGDRSKYSGDRIINNSVSFNFSGDGINSNIFSGDGIYLRYYL